ncbi:MAG TPA: hypothetical protein VF384_07880 [Planctomycetota bacterium]
MSWLLRKDRAWHGPLGVLGTTALAIAIMERGFVDTFVVTPGHREALFHTAWIAGMCLGLAAACFDEVLGTRELLQQRPLSASALLRARLVACAVVLAEWFVFAPVAAYIGFAWLDSSFELGHWRQWPSIWAAMVPAISACAIGLLAGSLPFSWWLRGLSLGALFFVSFPLAFWLGLSWPSWQELLAGAYSTPWFVGCHLVAAALAVLVATATAGERHDADVPLSPRVRLRVVAPLLPVAAALMCMGLMEVEVSLVQQLQRAYPRAVGNDRGVVLAVRDDRGLRWIVDSEHRLTGQRPPASAVEWVRFDWPRIHHGSFWIEGPRWRGHESFRSHGGRLLVDGDGTVWWHPGNGRLRTVAKPQPEPPFAAGTVAEMLGTRQKVVVLAERDAAAIWRFLPETESFERVPMPGGDVVVAINRHEPSDLVLDGAPAVDEGERLVRGKRFRYALRGGGLVAVAPHDAGTRSERASARRVRVIEPDPIESTVEFLDDAGTTLLRHTFAPRTAFERMLAGAACVLSALRPPVLQIAAMAKQSEPTAALGSRWPWLFDPLVTGGRRLWLVLVSCALAAGLAWRIRHRLLRLGAPQATRRFWITATLVLGPIGAFACLAFERVRAYTTPAVEVPAPPPRIATALADRVLT